MTFFERVLGPEFLESSW